MSQFKVINNLIKKVDYINLGKPGGRITINDIAEMLEKCYLQVATLKNIISGFRLTGIYPFNGDIFSEDEFMAASVTDVNMNSHLEVIAGPSHENP
ncbi:hypothetical protein RN001_007095 [Aquatica leii]|uniref:Uncharacterized protein n=1 Tax=Aquatica leii TaxID=1421715 RepID=A0AAN7P889_9COLE|nr:hypothetical protein RN001_007095 [Aquatica leii]